MKSSYIQNLGTGFAVFGAFVLSGWFLTGMDTLENFQGNHPRKSKGPVTVSREIHKPYHDSYTAEEYHYNGNWAPRFVAFYETPVKDKSKPNVLVASSMDDGIFDIMRMPKDIDGRKNKCAVCHGTERDYKTDL